ncbi:MAG: hypothetical protein ACRDL4_14900 [Thermoleophilaceae bacterium]
MRRGLPEQPAYDYGRCPCGGSYERRTIEVTFDELVLTDVPQASCPDCGSHICKARVLDRLERLLSGREQPG